MNHFTLIFRAAAFSSIKIKNPLNILAKTKNICKLLSTTYTDNVTSFSKNYYLYIYATGGAPFNGQYTWLSTDVASGLSFLYLTYKRQPQ